MTTTNEHERAARRHLKAMKLVAAVCGFAAKQDLDVEQVVRLADLSDRALFAKLAGVHARAERRDVGAGRGLDHGREGDPRAGAAMTSNAPTAFAARAEALLDAGYVRCEDCRDADWIEARLAVEVTPGEWLCTAHAEARLAEQEAAALP